MYFLAQVRNWFVVSLIEALVLKSDLRLYKFEKKILARRNYFDEIEQDNDDRDRVNSREVFGGASSSFQKLKKKINRGPDDLGVFHNVVSDGTAENFVMKSAFGFLGGVILTYVCYLFLIYSLNFTLRRATLICVALGVILSLGLAFSVKIRCTVLLCIPQLFSKRGRQALLAYAFILALSGPAKNTLHNVEVMSESLACGQEQLTKAENELLKCVHRPNTAVKQSLENMILKLDNAVKGYKNFIEKFYRDCEAVIETIIQAQEWLYSIYLLCNEKMGSPYVRCTNLLNEASQNYMAVSESEDWQKSCVMPTVQDSICPVKNDPICCVEDLPPFWPFPNHKKQLNEFRREALNLIEVKIETREIFTLPNHTATLREEYQGMATEIRQKTDQFLQYFDVMSVIFGIFILVLFIKVLIYRYKFLTEDEYDNRFITSDFVDIDKTRAEFGMQTLLPLEPRERKKYIRVTSMRLVSHERKRLVSSFVFLVFATFKIIIHMLTDCALYWMLSTMRRHGRKLLVSSERDVPQITLAVSGDGLFAELMQNITKTVRPYAVQQILDPIPCLPDPISPDWNRYLQILTLVLICWFLAFCEPYGLRLRHIVMVTYHPDRARERAIWLYNRILTTRINFVKFARRQLRRKYKDLDEETFFGQRFWMWKRPLKCLLCKEDLEDKEYVKCPIIGCVGIYCRSCFRTLKLCSICKDPSYYGDYSDVSEEKDSEEEEKIPCSRCHCSPGSKPPLRQHGSRTSWKKYNSARKWLHPKFQISTDTIIDLGDSYLHESDESTFREKSFTSIKSPSVLKRFAQRCRRPFGRIKEGPQKSESVTSRPMSSVKSRKKFSGKALSIFRWKLKDRISDEPVRNSSCEFRERFKNVYFVDVGKLKRQEKKLHEVESLENLRKLLSSDSLHFPTCPKLTEMNESLVDINCPVHGSRISSKKGRKKCYPMSGAESYQTGLTDKETQTSGSHHQNSSSSSRRLSPSSVTSPFRDFHQSRKRQKNRVRRKRRSVIYSSTSESSQGGGKPTQKDIARRVDTMKQKLSKFLKRKLSSSEDFFSDDEPNDRKTIRPDLLSDLPSSTRRDLVGYHGDSDD